MERREGSINDIAIKESERLFHWEGERRPDDHPGLGVLGLKRHRRQAPQSGKGAASAAYLAGTAPTQFETYFPALITAGVLCLLAALLILTIAPKPELDLATKPA